MDETDVRRWFADYLAAFVACASGAEPDVATLLHWYGVPLLLSTDAGAVSLTTADDVLGGVRRELDRLRAAGFRRSDELDTAVAVLNRATALYRATFVRRGQADAELGRATVSYVICDGPTGRRIAALLVHGA